MKLDKSYKVRVTPEQSKVIHDLMGKDYNDGYDYLYINSLGIFTYTNSRHFFDLHHFVKIQADDLIALLTDLSKSAENPPQGVELTPEFEAVEPRFKVGDKVYKSGDKVIVKKVSPDEVDNRINIGDTGTVINVCHPKEGTKLIQLELDNHPSRNFWWIDKNKVVLASETTSEQVLIDFDLERRIEEFSERMLRKLKHKSRQGYKGWETCKHGDLVQLLINHVDKGDPIDVANFCAFLFARGELLTESVLEE